MPEKNAFEFVFGGEGGPRIDRVLAENITSCSRSFLQKIVRDGKVTVNGVVVNGVGYGTAVIKKTASMPVTIERIPAK